MRKNKLAAHYMPGQWWDSVVDRWRQVSPETRPWTWTPPPPPPVQSTHPHSAVQCSAAKVDSMIY